MEWLEFFPHILLKQLCVFYWVFVQQINMKKLIIRKLRETEAQV